ncbi:hypothetical protein PR048_022012 [Dryococelus australis]|uniref:Supervillin n=1 Tax=Dryococelus australis TaxID=614101 RepID=A0ABQ9GZW9_9NEOP|nr:hypothetical protein PR048_022012 [Dryococelus australis]
MKGRGKREIPEKNPPTNGIVRHDPHVRKSVDTAGWTVLENSVRKVRMQKRRVSGLRGWQHAITERCNATWNLTSQCADSQTVSAGPRAWPVAAQGSHNMDTSCAQDSLRRDDQPDTMQPTPPVSRRRPSQASDERDTDRKRKWTLGGFFRRKKKEAVESESSSQEDENPPKKGFLARRKTRREKKKQKASKTVGTFDHIVVNPLTQKPKSPPNGTVQEVDVMATETSRSHRDSRDSQGGSVDRMSSRNSSGGSGSVEGSVRRVKRGFMTRVEARRDRQRGDSSSEEGDCFVNHSVGLPRFKSDDSIAGLHREGSFSRRSRGARTERYIKRLSRDEEAILKREAETDFVQRQRMCKSDAEGSFGRRIVPKWPQAQEANDYEPRPPINHNFVQKTVPNPHLTSSLDRKTQQSNLRVIGPHCRIPSPISSSKSSESVSRARLDQPRCRLGITSIEPLCKSAAPEFPITGQRSISYDSNIHRTLSSPPVQSQDEVMVVQFPVARLSLLQNKYFDLSSSMKGIGNDNQSCFAAFKQPPPPPPPRDPQRKIYSPVTVVSQQEATRPMSFAFESNTQQGVHQPFSEHSNRLLQKSEANCIPQNFPLHQQIRESNTGVPRVNNQRRSVSDEHITPQQPQHSFLSVRVRPSSVTPETMKSSSQKSPVLKRYITRNPEVQTHPRHQTPSSPPFQYFADQNPRSRKPIHIQYSSTNHEQPYLSDSQVVMKPPHPVTEFWRARDQEGLPRQRKIHSASPKPPLQPGARSDRSRSNSPRPDHAVSPEASRGKTQKFKVPPLTFPVRLADSQSSLSGQSDISSSLPPASSKFLSERSPNETCDSSGVPSSDSLRRKESFRPLSMVLENSESHEQSSQREVKEEAVKASASVQSLLSLKKEPPIPPARRSTRLSSTSSQEANDWMSEDGCDGRKKRRSTNLDDALTELEAIYKSLRLGDEDLLDQAERRDLPTAHQQFKDEPSNDNFVAPNFSRGAESDSGFNYGWGSSTESLHGGEHMQRRTRAPGLRRSGIPDRVGDDMAYRRLHPKEKQGVQDARNIVSQAGSYLLVSPALSQGTGSESSLPGLEAKTVVNKLQQEPDVTYDDMLFRNIRQANNTLKVMDPQPPFGIPLGPITAAPKSDYLHAIPGDKYRPTFKPRKSPDVVKDDLAFRNLRKDEQKDPVLLPVDDLNNFLNSLSTNVNQKRDSNFSLRKKRAVRSLSANLQSIVKREALSLPASAGSDIDIEKAQSLSDLPDALQVAQKILEGKVVIGGGSAKLRERTVNTSTETLTDSRANLMDGGGRRTSWQQKLRVYIPPPLPQETALHRPPPPVTLKEISDNIPGSPIDEGHLEEMLSALAREAKATSEKLGKELKELADETSNIPFLKASILGTVEKSNKETQTPENIDPAPVFPFSKKLPDSLQENEFLDTNSLQKNSDAIISEKVEPNLVDDVQHSSLAKLLHEEHVRHRKEMLLELELQQLDQKPEKQRGNVSPEQTKVPASRDNTFNNNSGEVVNGDKVSVVACDVGEAKCEVVSSAAGSETGVATPETPDGTPQKSSQGGDAEKVEPGTCDEADAAKSDDVDADATADASPPMRPGDSGGETPRSLPGAAQLLVARSYCISCTHSMDSLTAFGLLLAVCSVIAYLIL